MCDLTSAMEAVLRREASILAGARMLSSSASSFLISRSILSSSLACVLCSKANSSL